LKRHTSPKAADWEEWNTKLLINSLYKNEQN
jgi:hypothetical protein